MAADRGIVDDGRDAMRRQRGAGPHARELQELRRVHRAAAQDHLARGRRKVPVAIARPFHARRAALFDADLGGPGMQFELDVVAAKRRPHEGVRRRPAPAVANGQLVAAEPLGMFAVEIIRPRHAKFAGRRLPRCARCVQVRGHVLDVERAGGASPPLRIDAAFRPLEVRPHVVPGPAHMPHRPPVVEIGGHPAAINQRVDGTRASEHAASRPIHGAALEARYGCRLVSPVDRGIGEGAAVTDRRLDPEAGVRSTRLENQDPLPAARRQSLREHAAGRARADDDEVELFHAAGSLSSSPVIAMPFRDPPMSFFEKPRSVAQRGRTLYRAVIPSCPR